jgi:hypothetical protein
MASSVLDKLRLAIGGIGRTMTLVAGAARPGVADRP